MFLRGRTMFAPTMRVVDGADPYKLKLKHSQQTKQKCAFHPVSAQTKFMPAPLFSAGVQTMRARICSALSCDMFARVV